MAALATSKLGTDSDTIDIRKKYVITADALAPEHIKGDIITGTELAHYGTQSNIDRLVNLNAIAEVNDKGDQLYQAEVPFDQTSLRIEDLRRQAAEASGVDWPIKVSGPQMGSAQGHPTGMNVQQLEEMKIGVGDVDKDGKPVTPKDVPIGGPGIPPAGSNG